MSQQTAASRPPGRGSLLFSFRKLVGPYTAPPGNRDQHAGIAARWALLLLTLFVVSFAPVVDLVPWILTPYDQKRAAELTILTLSLTLATLTPRGLVPLPRSAVLGVLTVFALGAASAVMAPSPRHAGSEIALLGALMLLVLNLAAIYEKHRDRALLLTGCMLSLGMLTLTTAFLAGCVAALIQARPLNVFEIVPGFSNIRFLNQIQTWSIPLLALCVFARTRPPRLLVIAGYTAISGSWLILFATGARGSMLALATASVLSVLVLGRRTRPFLKLQGIGLLAGFLAERLIFHLAPRWFGLGESLLFDLGRTSDTGRIALWKQAWALLAENPLLGIGPQHFAWFENAFSLAHPHNAPLQIASEWGLPGALLLAALLGWGFLRWTSTARDQPPGADPTTDRAILWIALVAGATHSLLAGIIVMPLSQLLMTIVCAAALGTHMAQGESRGSATAGGHVATRLAAGFLLVLLLVSMGPELATRLSGDELLPAGRVVLGPRIWQLGGIPH